MVAYEALLLLFACERIAELLLSRRNARIAFGQGAVESGAKHFRVMVLLHALFLPCCWLTATHFVWQWAALALGAQALRWWAIATLGSRWNTRVIVIPGAPPIAHGPYKFLRHPNYLAVCIEMLAVPLAGGAWICAIVFSIANALILQIRIRVEEEALYG